MEPARYAATASSAGPCALQGGKRAAAKAAADEDVDPVIREQAREGAVAHATRPDDLRGDDLAILDVVQLEALRPAKVLEHVSVLVGNCNSRHVFLQFAWPRLRARGRGGKRDASAPDCDALAVYQRVRDVMPRPRVHRGDRCPGNAHALCRLPLVKPLEVDQAYRLELVERELHAPFVRRAQPAGGEGHVLGHDAHAPWLFLATRHLSTSPGVAYGLPPVCPTQFVTYVMNEDSAIPLPRKAISGICHLFKPPGCVRPPFGGTVAKTHPQGCELRRRVAAGVASFLCREVQGRGAFAR